MSIEQIGLVAAAGVVAAWPHLSKLARGFLPAGGPAAPAVSYEAAIKDLALVRSRLAGTGLLTDDAKKAIDTLTLALVAGSDK